MPNYHAVKSWFLTYPQCDVNMHYALEKLKTVDKINEYVIAQEQHKDGGLHLHAFIRFEKGVKVKEATPKLDLDNNHGNYQPARSCKAVIQYCIKEDNYISNINIKNLRQKKGKTVTADLIKAKTAKKALEDGDISYHTIKAYNTARSVLQDPYTHSTVRGYWYVGPPGTGKSHKARTENPDSYLKAQNKWFDGYEGQKVIILDDFDEGGKCLGHYLKIWADKWPCTGEIKGATCQLTHEKFIITSNFLIEDIWNPEQEPQMYEAIRRRFTVVNFHTMFKAKEVGDNRMTFTEEQVYRINV